MAARPNLLSVTTWALRALVGMNFIYGAGIAGLLIASLVASHWVQLALGFRAEAPPALMIGIRLIMVIGLIAVPLAYLVFARLLAVVETVRHGDPFIPQNARRLKAIALASLGIQLLQLAVGAVCAVASTPDDPLDIHWDDSSVDGWLFVLLTFVLARVFDLGTRMRADLEGTI